MMIAEVVYSIKELAQEFMEAPKIITLDNHIVLAYDYESETGEYFWKGILFREVIAWRHFKESEIIEYVKGSYNSISIIKDSLWQKEYCADITICKHYLVYFDGYGTYEFLAQDFTTDINVDRYINAHS